MALIKFKASNLEGLMCYKNWMGPFSREDLQPLKSNLIIPENRKLETLDFLKTNQGKHRQRVHHNLMGN
jgi:hypothetical protein